MPLDRPPYPPQPAQPPGKTYCQYSPNGERLLVAGCANYARSFRTNDDGEPDVLDGIRDDTLALVVGDDYCILGTEDGAVCEYSVPSGQLKDILVRFTLPVRDIAIEPVSRNWIAVCSDEVEVKIVNRFDIERIVTLREHPRAIKHVSYDPTGTYLAASCVDGRIYVYDVQDEAQPKLHKTIDGIIQRLDGVDEATSKAVWHPQGAVFACANASREVVVVDLKDGKTVARFSGGHDGKITSIAWSSNGALLASAATDDTLVIWNAKTQQMLMKNNYEKILCCEWHPNGENLFSWTNGEGECFIIPGFLSRPDHVELLSKSGSAIFGKETPAQQQKLQQVNGHKALVNGRARGREKTPDSLDGYLNDADDQGWIEDDDGAGYKNANGKRAGDEINGHDIKRSRHYFEPEIHESFQPGATPWRGNRKYLCLNLTGFVWTVNNDTHNTVTIEFYDREMHRDFHFTDPFQYDKACLNEQGCLFACPPANGQPAMVFYRPHETWTNRTDFRIQLPDGEDISCIALSNRYIVACTTANYVRVWTLFGTPYKIWRLKSAPAVTCAAHGDYLMTVCNGPVSASGGTHVTYTIDNLRHDETCQSEDLVALGRTIDMHTEYNPDDEDPLEDVTLKTLFWTDTADPAIYDSSGTLLVLQHWRTPGQAKWVPILDTRRLSRLQDGKKQETYWPVAVADEKFHCIILKGGDAYPYFPRPLLTEFELEIPIARPIKAKKATYENSQDEDLDDTTTTSNAAMAQKLEETYVRTSLLLSLLDDMIQSKGGHASHRDKTETARREIEVDKTLLQLLAVECREGEERGMKALEIVSLMRDRGGKMIEAASKVAGRWGRSVLEEKIRGMGERRLAGIEED